MTAEIFTIGHSTHPADVFIALLQQHGVTALCDVRTKPFSRWNPQFNKSALEKSLRAAGIAYVFLGAELGGKPEDPACYIGGKVSYERIAETQLFKNGIARVEEGSRTYRLALMCAEKDPVNCHRFHLVAPFLAQKGYDVRHILADGGLETHEETLARLPAKKQETLLFPA